MGADYAIFIYGLKDPRTGLIMYVGETVDPKRRLQSHIWPPAKAKSLPPVSRWVLSLRDDGVAPEMVILEECAASHSRGLEDRWIANHRKTNPGLLNVPQNEFGVPRKADARRKCIGVHLNDTEFDALNAYAAGQGLSRVDAIRAWIGSLPV
jgi:hypothetical protein